MSCLPEFEVDMTAPTLELFPSADYLCLEQVPLGRKKIDLVCLKKSEPFTTTIELKIENWKHALWQASLNCQVANESYIAIWHSYVHRAEKNSKLLSEYGVGLISVYKSSAEILIKTKDPVRRIAKSKKLDWYKHLLGTE